MMLVAAGVIGAGLAITRWFSADFYDIIIVKMTSVWYYAVLQSLPDGARVLDIGIGTATALIKNKDLIKSKNISVVGVDYDSDYIRKAKKIISEEGMAGLCEVHCKSVYDADLASVTGATKEPFDVIYFSGSFTLLPSPKDALKTTAKLLKSKESGRIIITQTFQREHILNPVIAMMKPLAKYITRIDFGQLTKESDLLQTIKDANMKPEVNKVIEGSIDTSLQAARMVVVNPF